MPNGTMTSDEREQLKDNMLKFVNRQLDPKCPADRDSEGMRILPSLIEMLTRGI